MFLISFILAHVFVLHVCGKAMQILSINYTSGVIVTHDNRASRKRDEKSRQPMCGLIKIW